MKEGEEDAIIGDIGEEAAWLSANVCA